MKRSTLLVLIGLILAFLVLLFLLRSYQLDLVHSVVINAVIQKAPEDYPQDEIRRTFALARERFKAQNREDVYLRKLFELSQRLEKIQALSRSDLQEMLVSLEEASR